MYKEIKEVLKIGGEFYEVEDLVNVTIYCVTNVLPRDMCGRISRIYLNEIGEHIIRLDCSEKYKSLIYDIPLKSINIVTRL